MSIKLVVWDWNGTLFDDTQAIVDAMNLSDMPLFELANITIEEYQELYEVPITLFFQKLGVSHDALENLATERSERFLRQYEPLAMQTYLREGALSALETMQNKGLTNIVLSNHTLEGIYQQLARLGITKMFESVLANDVHAHVHRQGKKHRLETFMKAKDISHDQIMIIGDTIEEIHIAKDLDLVSVSITGGCCTEQRLKDARPDYLIHSLDELTNIVEGIA